MSDQVAIEIYEAPAIAVEVVEEGGVEVVEILHPGPQGPSAARARRHAWSAPFSYCGTAPVGTAESTASWTVTRIQIGSTGAVLATGTATNATWTGRTGHTYT